MLQVKDALMIMISFGTLLISFVMLIVMIIIAICQRNEK